MIYLILFLMLISSNLHANDQEVYLVENPDGSVRVIHYLPGSNDSIAEVLSSFGFLGLPVMKIKESDIPQDPVDRKYWKVGVLNKIEIDNAKKSQDQAEEAAKDIRKKALLKMNDAEFIEAKQLGIVK